MVTAGLTLSSAGGVGGHWMASVCSNVSCSQEGYTPICSGKYATLQYNTLPSSSIIMESSSSCSSFFSCLCLKFEIIDRFWSSRCLNYHIDVPHKIGSISSGSNMSHGNGSSTLVSQHIWKWLTVYYSMDLGQSFSCKKLVGCHSLYGSNFDF